MELGSNYTPNEVAWAHLRKARRSFQAPERLLKDGLYEDSVSRAYYAMFHAAKACLANENLFPKTHSGVISEFGRVFVIPGKVDEKLGQALSEAKEEREDSDYEAFVEVEEREAGKILADAADLLEKSEAIVARTESDTN